jgi:uncharacterized membrane protein YdjX (TVP38/TMEM64 family)
VTKLEAKFFHKEIKRNHKNLFKKIEYFFLKRYPKLSLLILFMIAAYFIFSNQIVQNFVSNLGDFGYPSIFIMGLLFSFGFTTPISVGFFVVSNPDNIFLAAILGGFGALISDLLIFKFVRFSFIDEFHKLEKSKIITKTSDAISSTLTKKMKLYLLYAFAGLIIASPLPDEAGVIMLAGLTKINALSLSVISLIFNSLGIFIFLLI